ncbi:phage tail tape measure protein [Bacillus cereus]
MEVFKMFGSVFLKDEKARKGLKDLDAHASKTSQGMGSKFGSLGGVFGKLGGSIGGAAVTMAGMAGVAVGVGAAFVGMVKEGMSYEKQLSKVEAISGSSASQMASLSGKARELGATTRYSATEAAQGMEYMALAGWKTNDILAGTGHMLNLATAGNMDLARAADIVTDTMTPFGMSASQAGRATDVFAAAQANANTNVEQMGEAMKYAAAPAAAFGMNIEEASVLIMEFANAGIKGSMAGTALRAGISRLAAPPKPAAKALDQLGVSVKNADGSMKKMGDIIGELSPKFNALSESEQIATAKAIFGEEAYSAWLGTLKGGKEEFERFKNLLDGSAGAADRMAKVMSNNLEGATKSFTSNLSNLGLTLFSQVNPGLKGLVNGSNDFVTSITKAIDPTGKMYEATMLLDKSNTELAMSQESLKLAYEQGSLSKEDYIRLMDEAARKYDENTTGAGLLRQKLAELDQQLAAGEISQDQYTIKKAEAVKYTEDMQKAIDAQKEKEQQWQDVLSKGGEVWGVVVNTSAPFIELYRDIVKEVTEKASAWWSEHGAAIKETGQDMWGTIQQIIQETISFVTGIIREGWEFVKGVWGEIAPYIMPILMDVVNFVNEQLKKIEKFWKENGQQIMEAVHNAFEFIKSVISVVMPIVFIIIKDIWENIKGVISGALDIIMGLIKVFSSLLTGDWKGVWEGIKQILSGAWQFIWNFIQLWGVGKVLGIVAKIGSKMKGLFKEAWEGVKKVFSDMFKGIFKSSEDTFKVIKDTFGKVKDAIANPFKDAWNGVKDWIDKIKNGVRNMFSGVKIPTPQITTSGSLNPLNWMSEGLPKFNIKWAAKGALVKPGMPTLIGVGDAKGYDEAVLPLRDSTLGRIGQEIAQTMQGGSGKTEIVELHITNETTLDGKVVARKLAPTINIELEGLKRRKK